MSCLTFGKWLLTISLFPILSVNDMTVLFILIAVYLGSYRKIGRGYAGAMMFIPAILGAILLNALPQHKKIGLLFSYWLTSALCCLDECSSIRMPLFSRRYLLLWLSWDGLDHLLQVTQRVGRVTDVLT